MKIEKDTITRREFAKSCMRNTIIGGLAVLGGFLIFKKKSHPTGNQTCLNQGICRGCKAFNDCGLPQALSAKAYRANENSGH